MVLVGISLVLRASFLTQSDWSALFSNHSLWLENKHWELGSTGKFWKNDKKTLRYHHFTHVYHKWQSYDVWFLRYEARQNFLSLWAIFCPLTPSKFFDLLPQSKFWKNEKKRMEISFYISVPKIMIICYTVPEIRCVTDVIAIYLEISSFYTRVPKIMIRWCTVPEIWWLTDGRTDGWTDGKSDI